MLFLNSHPFTKESGKLIEWICAVDFHGKCCLRIVVNKVANVTFLYINLQKVESENEIIKGF